MTRSANEIVVFFAFGMPVRVMIRSPREIIVSDMLQIAQIKRCHARGTLPNTIGGRQTVESTNR